MTRDEVALRLLCSATCPHGADFDVVIRRCFALADLFLAIAQETPRKA